MKLIIFALVILLFLFSYFGGLYMMFVKAREKGWKALIPIYDIIVLLKILGKPRWFVVFLIIPVISNLVFIYLLIQMYERFGIRRFWKLLFGVIFSIVFLPIVGFSKKYVFEVRDAENYNFGKDLKIWSYSIVFILAAVIFIRALNIFWFQNYKLPTGAMKNTLLIGDHFLVNKFVIGPRMPITPLAIPFYYQTIPLLNIPSYIKSVELPYFRLSKTPNVHRNDIIAFNFPEGDTVCLEYQSMSYYAMIRSISEQLQMSDPTKSQDELFELARKHIRDKYTITYRPIDRRDSYVKRCVALPGDSLKITRGILYVNGNAVNIPEAKYLYTFKTDGSGINDQKWKELDLQDDIYFNSMDSSLSAHLSANQLKIIQSIKQIKAVKRTIYDSSDSTFNVSLFPNDIAYKWTPDNFGIIYVPKKGESIKLTLQKLPLYKRIISTYEKNNLEVKNGEIFINGKPTTVYTFKMNYYWMMGDNWHDSADSRYWGFVPEDHLIGKVSLIWWSNDKSKIRWERIFMKV